MKKSNIHSTTIIVLFFVLLSAHVIGQSIKKGPYLIFEGTNTEMKVVWQDEASYTDIIRWGTTTSYSDGNANSPEYGSDHQHAYVISGLTPGTKYYYQVESTGSTYNGSFYATPDVSATSLKFLAYGDTRSYPNDHNLVAEEIISTYTADPEYQSVLISMGDLVNDGNSEGDWSGQFFETGLQYINSMLANIPYQSCMGNHEGNGVLFQKYFPYNFQSNRYYSFDYGPALFIILDQYVSYTPGSAQYIWLENELSTTTKAWKIIYYHEPGWTAGGHSNNTNVQNYIQPLCEQYGVKITFAGHNHYYSRAEVTLNNTTVQHITTGGGGAPLYDPDPSDPYIVVTSKSHHFCKINIVDDNAMYVDVIDKDGTLLDQFTINQSNNSYPSVSITAPSDNTHYNSPQSITISADATDSDGTISQVEFFVEGASVGTDNSSPYSIDWSIPDNGAYSITAKATDDLGAFTNSTPINITVGVFTELVSSRISSGNDDVEEASDGRMYLTSTDIELVYDSHDDMFDQTVGLRFTGLGIPHGVTINSAHIQFTVDEVTSGATDLTIFGHDIDDSPGFSSTANNVSYRTKTTASAAWIPPAWSVVGEAGIDQQTPDLSGIIQEIVDRPAFSQSSAISLIITGTGTRVAEAYEGVAVSAALLTIDYTSATAPGAPLADFTANVTTVNPGTSISFTDNSTGTPTSWSWSFQGVTPSTSSLQNPTVTYYTVGTYDVLLTATNTYGNDTETKTGFIIVNSSSIVVEIANDNDDVEERESNGSLYFNSSDIEMCYDGNRGHQHVGLRFQDVDIPQGATVTNAYIEFRADESNSQDITLTIAGDDDDDSPDWSGNYNVSNRVQTTAKTTWNPEAWTADTTYNSDGISAIIEEIVSRTGWVSGNSLSLIIYNNGTDTDKRVADSYDGNWPAKLYIDYGLPGLWTGTTSSDWSNTSNWDNGNVPSATDDVTIPTGLTNYPVVDETATCLSLNILTGAQITINAGADLTTSEDIHVYGTLQIDLGTVNTASGMEIHVYNGGTFDLNGGTVNIDDEFRTKAGCTIDISGGVLNIGDDWESAYDGASAKGTINLSGGAVYVADDCKFSSSDVSGSMSGDFTLTIDDDFKISSSQWGTPTGGTIVLTGTGTSGPGFVADIYSNDADEDVVAYNLTLNGGDTINFNIASNSTGTSGDYNQGIHIYNDFTVIAGTVETKDANGHTDKLDVDGTFTLSSGARFKDAVEDADNYSISSFSFDPASTYRYYGAGTRTVSYTPTYGILEISTSTLANIGGSVNTNGDLYILDGGTMTLSTGANVTVSGGNNEDLEIGDGGKLIVNNGTLDIEDNLYVGQGISGEFQLTGGSVDVGADFRTVTGCIVDIDGGDIHIHEDWERATTLPAYGTIQLSGGTIEVDDDCEFAETDVTGTMNGPFNLHIGDRFRISHNGWSTVTDGTVTIDNSGSITSFGTNHAIVWNLVIDGTTVELNTNAVINNRLTVNSGKTLNINTDNDITVLGP